MYTISKEKEFLQSYSCHLTITGRLTFQAGSNGTCQLSPQKDNVRFQNSFFPDFLLIHRAKYIFSRDMFCLYHLRAKIHSVSVKQCMTYFNLDL